MFTITESMIMDTLYMFVFLVVELTLLFLLISYFVGILQEYIPPEKIEKLLSGKHPKGYVIATLLAAITPFCSCSTIPFIKGLLRAKAGFGTILVFLFASPLLNPIIIGLFAVTFGIDVALFYFIVSMSIAISAGYILEKLGFEKYIKPEAYSAIEKKQCCPVSTDSACSQEKVGFEKYDESEAEKAYNKSTKKKVLSKGVFKKIWISTWHDFIQVIPYLFIGIAVGSLIYGFLPTDFLASVANDDNIFAIPVAAVIGIPLYIRAEAVIPLSAALVAKGMGLGAVMALIIGSAGASLTEIILLKSIFKNQLIIAFLIVVLGMAVCAGFLYQYLF